MKKNKTIIGIISIILIMLVILIGIFLFQDTNKDNQKAEENISQIQEQQVQSNETIQNNENVEAQNITRNEDSTNEPEEEQANNQNRNETEQEKENNMNLIINNRTFKTTVYDNQATKAFLEMLPMTITMEDMNRNEKYHYLPSNLPTATTRPSRIQTGDIMLYGSNCLVVFYETFSTSYSYTPLGKIDDIAGLKEALGSGSVTIRFE